MSRRNPKNYSEALLDATANLAGAASAYRKYAKRDASLRPKAEIDPFFTTRADDMDKAAERARRNLKKFESNDEEIAKLRAQNVMLSTLMRIAIQSFDGGGESMRSQRAQAIEAAWTLVTDYEGDPRFAQEYAECDADAWAYITKARLLAYPNPEITDERD